MQDLLPHYERELGFLRNQAKEFGQRYPRIAGQLATTGEVLEDPHVERLLQAFALLASRVHKRLDDDFPLVTESLLEVLYPHYLRPFPACSIASFDVASQAAQLTQGSTVAAGTLLTARAVRGVTCKFRTAYDVQLLPLRVSSVQWRAAIAAPSGTVLPKDVTTVLSVQVELISPQAKWDALGVDNLRLYIDGDASMVSAVREAVLGNVKGCLAQTAAVGPWIEAPNCVPRGVGFDDKEALIPFDARSHQAYRLLTEYFAFPEKFNFIDLPLPRALRDARGRSVTLHYVMAGLRGDSDDARLLETITAKNLLLGCTPVVNLFGQRADPIRVTQQSTSQPVLPDARRAFGYEVYAVNRVFRIQQTAQGETVQEFRPFYSLNHDELLAGEESAGRYWYLQRDTSVADRSPGFETEIGIVDAAFDPAHPQTDTLSIDVMATNRDLPSQLTVGLAGGDLFMEGGSVAREIRMLRKPTPTYRFERGHGALWRLVSHLSLNHLSLTAAGMDALKETLRLYDLPRSPGNRRLIDGLVNIDLNAATAWMRGNPFETMVRGTQISLTVNEQHFVGTGLQLFATVMDRFFGLYAHVNSFTHLRVFSARSKELLVDCPRRSGEQALI